MSLRAGDMLYDRAAREHLLLLRRDAMIDDDDIEKPVWHYRTVENGRHSWCWEFILEDEVDFWVVQ